MMKPLTICAVLFALSPTLICQQVEQSGITADEVIGRMLASDTHREALSQGYSGTRRYQLENDRLNKRAELVAAVHCDPDGTKHFAVISEAGWASAISRVLRKMLDSEAETSTREFRAKARLSADNYDFSMVGTERFEDRPTYVINVIPKRRDKYLMEGRVWVDATDYALVRAEGQLAHNPSFWTRTIHFVQQYQKQGAFWFPSLTDSIAEARIFGTTHVNISHINYVPNTSHSSVPEEVSLRETSYAKR